MGKALALLSRFNSVGTGARRLLNESLDRLQSGFMSVRPPVDLGIVTALDHEFVAAETCMTVKIRGVGGRVVEHEAFGRAPVKFKVIEFEEHNEVFRVVLTQSIKMGNNSAAIATTAMLYEFPEVQDVLMVGIAGGIPSPLKKNDRDSRLVQDHVRLGDIFVSEQPVLQYDYVHRGGQETTNRSNPISISHRIQLAFQALRHEELRRRYPWEPIIERATARLGRQWNRPAAKFDAPSLYDRDGNGNVVPVGQIRHPSHQPRRRRGKPMVHYGRIGSANMLLADAMERERIRVEHGVRAVEMEGSGLADAAWNFGVGYAVVRGICDYCDAGKDNRWQMHASICAGAYARQLVTELISARGPRPVLHTPDAPAAKRRNR